MSGRRAHQNRHHGRCECSNGESGPGWWWRVRFALSSVLRQCRRWEDLQQVLERLYTLLKHLDATRQERRGLGARLERRQVTDWHHGQLAATGRVVADCLAATIRSVDVDEPAVGGTGSR
jgi:hypothetical protein